MKVSRWKSTFWSTFWILLDFSLKFQLAIWLEEALQSHRFGSRYYFRTAGDSRRISIVFFFSILALLVFAVVSLQWSY
ncbi:hypothetical protein Tsubulata_027813 [Turnera subulata]|uniref:Uncharacterized protein n=1 Tax=Turnera subulata TaxID=218843 RepID=A0A9Q0FJ07_9ROSI|nr:hypothetical protein Tsubulata_027813 [Turnera subulata]